MKKGFTLIELLIVITIIGILAVAFLPSLLGAPSKARDTQRIADVQKIAGVLTAEMVMDPAGMPDTACVSDSLAGIDAPDFGGIIPTDPSETSLKINGFPSTACAGSYVYMKAPSDDYSFGIYAELENATGNFDCGSSTPGVLLNTGLGGCYAVLVQ